MVQTSSLVSGPVHSTCLTVSFRIVNPMWQSTSPYPQFQSENSYRTASVTWACRFLFTRSQTTNIHFHSGWRITSHLPGKKQTAVEHNRKKNKEESRYEKHNNTTKLDNSQLLHPHDKTGEIYDVMYSHAQKIWRFRQFICVYLFQYLSESIADENPSPLNIKPCS